MERYIGLDAHGQSCTFAVMGPSGRRIRHDVVETNGAALVWYVKALPGRKHLCREEGTHSAWLYEILSPHVEEIVVAGIHERNHAWPPHFRFLLGNSSHESKQRLGVIPLLLLRDGSSVTLGTDSCGFGLGLRHARLQTVSSTPRPS